MNRIMHFVLPALGGLLSCFPIEAQMRVHAPAPNPRRVQPSQPAHMRTIMPAPDNRAIQNSTGAKSCCNQGTVVHALPAEHAASGNWRLINAGNIDAENEVPGLGFDFPHLAAIRGRFPVNLAFQLARSGVHTDPFGRIFFIGNPGFQGVPGLGFDFPHLAAISGNVHFNPAFEHDRFNRNGSSFAPIFWSDISGYSDFVDSSALQQTQQEFQQQGQQQPQIIVIQQPVPIAREAPAGRDQQAASNSQAPSSSPSISSPVAPTPIRDVGEFIFVRRDGRILFASAFFVGDGLLQYVTPEGIRRTIPVAELDTDSTRKMNDALGTKVDLRK